MWWFRIMLYKYCVAIIALILKFNACCEAAKILFTAAVDSGTHIGSMTPLIERAAQDGHDVTVFETSSLKKARSFNANVTVIFIQVPQNKDMSKHLSNLIFCRSIRSDTLLVPFKNDDDKMLEFLRGTSNTVTIRNLINTKWDLVVIDEIFGVHSFAIAMHLKKFRNTPYIVYSTTVMIHTTIHNLALGRNYVSEPNLLTAAPVNDADLYSASKISNRIDNIYNILMDLYYVNYYVASNYMKSVKMLGVDFSFNKLYEESAWIFADYVTHMRFVLSEGTEIRPVAETCRSAGVLSGEIARFIEDPSSMGTIYVAFGSYINWMHAPQRMVDAFFDALNQFHEYRIVFSYNGPPQKQRLRSHIMLIKWAPQLEILTHPKTRIFISHGGLKSWKESLCNAHPVVYMPVFAEQTYNAKLALRMGYASVLNKFTVDSKQLTDSIKKIIGNYSLFKRNAIRARDLYLDSPISALDNAMHAFQRVLKSAPTRKTHFARKGIQFTTAESLYALHMTIIGLAIFILTY